MAGASGDCPAPRQLTPSPPASRLPQRPRFELLQTGQPATQALGITSVPAQGTPCPASLAVSAAAPTRQRTGRLGLSPSGWAGRRNSIRNERPRPAPGAPCRGPGEAACRTVPPAVRREARGARRARRPRPSRCPGCLAAASCLRPGPRATARTAAGRRSLSSSQSTAAGCADDAPGGRTAGTPRFPDSTLSSRRPRGERTDHWHGSPHPPRRRAARRGRGPSTHTRPFLLYLPTRSSSRAR